MSEIDIKRFREKIDAFRLLDSVRVKMGGESNQLLVDIDDLLSYLEKVQTELKEGDYWQQRSKEFFLLGGCPVCFATDEEGYKEKCPWGETESFLEKWKERAYEFQGKYLDLGEINQQLRMDIFELKN